MCPQAPSPRPPSPRSWQRQGAPSPGLRGVALPTPQSPTCSLGTADLTPLLLPPTGGTWLWPRGKQCHEQRAGTWGSQAVPRSPLPGARSQWSLCCRVVLLMEVSARPCVRVLGSLLPFPALPPAPSPQESHLPGLLGLQAVGAGVRGEDTQQSHTHKASRAVTAQLARSWGRQRGQRGDS